MADKTKKTEKLNASVEYKGEGELITDRPSEPLVFVCEKCGKEYKTKRGYDNHIKKCVMFEDVVIEEVIEEVKEEVKEEIKEEIKEVNKPNIFLQSNKTLFNNLVLENKPFILKYFGSIIFDSDKDSLDLLDFQENTFSIKNVTNTYDGLSFKFKK